eukprot:scaffold116283_cov45-Phaeocystis_antarctica.AAC.1
MKYAVAGAGGDGGENLQMHFLVEREVDVDTEVSDIPSAVAAASHSEASVIIPEPQLRPLVFT